MIHFIGVGPGDPQLMTLKAVQCLQEADVIFHAGHKDGAGIAYRIVEPFIQPKQEVHSIELQMVRGDDDWRKRYRSGAQRLADESRGGRRVAFITEGDPTLYSTASFLWQLLEEEHPEVLFEIVPGVTSITAAAGRARRALARKEERLAVLPAAYLDAADFHTIRREFEGVVLLKPEEACIQWLDSLPQDWDVCYAEHVTTPNETIVCKREEIKERLPPYFSLLTLKRRPISSVDRQGELSLIGLGPGDVCHLTAAARQALRDVDAIVGYSAYLEQLKPLRLRAELFPRPIGQEKARTQLALDLASQGRRVALVSSGDAGIYGMASILLETIESKLGLENPPPTQIIPGVTAATASASLLGAPLGHDFACISLSDLLTPFDVIERRLEAAGRGDFVVVLYNPVSSRRTWQLPRAAEIFLEHRSPTTPVGLVDSAYRPDQRVEHLTLAGLLEESQSPTGSPRVTMTTTVIVGNKQTRFENGWMITPRGLRGAEA